MSGDDAYIQPSKRERYRPKIHGVTGERTPGDLGLSNLMLLQVLASHAVVDSILAEAIADLRFARAQDFRGREDHDWAGCAYFGGEEQCRICRRDALIARYDALHKEAGQ